MTDAATDAATEAGTDAATEAGSQAPPVAPVSGWEPSGHPRVDAAIAGLDELTVLPTSEHADVYEDVHRRLHEALADLDGE